MSEPEDPSSSRVEIPTAAELQRSIASVTGVETAVVTPTVSGRDRLRISLRSGEDPDEVAWAVAATLRERFGIALDPADITTRVVDRPEPAEGPAAAEPPGEVADEPQPPPAPDPPRPDPVPARAVVTPSGGAVNGLVATARHALAVPVAAAGRPHRAAIRELTTHPNGTALEVAATLGLAGRESTGRARGVRTRRGRWRAIAEATLAALDGLAANGVLGHVDHVTVLTLADLAHVSVLVTLLTERGEETFLGSALVRDDADRAVMRAALDAVNRRVEPWLADPPAEAG